MKVLATLLRLIGAPPVVRRPGNYALLAPPSLRPWAAAPATLYTGNAASKGIN